MRRSGPEEAASVPVSSSARAVNTSIWRRRDVTGWIGRRRRRVGGIGSRANHGTNCDTRGDTAPARSAAVVAIAAAATADVHVTARVKIARVRHVPVKFMAVEAAAAVRPAGRAPTTATAAATMPLHKDQSGVVGQSRPARCSRNGIRCERRYRCRRGAAGERQGDREQQRGSPAHFSAPNTSL